MSLSAKPERSAANESSRAFLAVGLFFLCFAAVIVGLVLGWELENHGPPPELGGLEKWVKSEWDGIAGIAAAVGTVGLLTYGVLRKYALSRRPAFVRLTLGVLMALIFVAGFAEFYGRKIQRVSFAHRWDVYHYAIGPKYYEELDYFALYDCTVVALPRKQLPDSTKIKDLRTHLKTTAGSVRAHNDCNERFTPKRWQEFRHDVSTLRELGKPEQFGHVLGDRGYNGTPFHSLVAGKTAELIRFSPGGLNRAALIDLIGLWVLFVVVTRAFGWRVGLVFALFFVTNVVDRNGALGASFLRYLWMISLGLGVSMLKLRRYAGAGFFLVAAAMLNVFPLLFMLGPIVKGVVEWVRTRRLAPHYRRFFASLTLSTLLLGGASVAHADGIGNYENFFDNMEVHMRGTPTEKVDDIETMPGFGVGLKFPFMYRGQHSSKDKFSRVRKSEEFREIKPMVVVIALGLLGFATMLASRLDDVEASVLVGFTAFFGLLGTVGYYFTCASLLILLLHRRIREPGGLLLTAALFSSSALGHLALYETHYVRLVNNTIISTLWTIWLVAVLVYLGNRTGLTRRLGRLFAAPAGGDGRGTGDQVLGPGQ